MSFRGIVLILFALWPLASADVKFTFPGPGGKVPGGTDFVITWVDSGSAPSISDLEGYTITLYSGSNSAPSPLLTLVPSGTFVETPNSASIKIPVTIGGPTPNAYFLGIQSTAKSGGFVVNYSNRFTITGMTGTFPDPIKTALVGIPGTAGPPTDKTNMAAALARDGAAVGGAGFEIPYDEQVGNTKYAPMQPIPHKTITATNTKPLWPTSSVMIATTFLPVPSVVTTLTQSNTQTATMHPNTAAAQSQPADAMQKFLNRWKD